MLLMVRNLGIQKFVKGISGIQGPLYTGTGTFHRRKVMYGLPLAQVPNEITSGKTDIPILTKFVTFFLS